MTIGVIDVQRMPETSGRDTDARNITIGNRINRLIDAAVGFDVDTRMKMAVSEFPEIGTQSEIDF